MNIEALRILCKIQSGLIELMITEDEKQSSDDMELGLIEGKISAYRHTIINVNHAIADIL
jgi:hypothetical protein